MTVEPDAIRQRLDALADELERNLAGVAEVRRSEPHFVEVTPRNHRAVGVIWFDTGDELQVETLGDRGGRWQLRRSEADAALVEELVRAVVAGRVSEVFGPHRSAVTVTFEDGSTDTEVGYGPGAFLPRPGWKRRGRQVKYEPYRR